MSESETEGLQWLRPGTEEFMVDLSSLMAGFAIKKKEPERQRGWGTLGANNRLQMPLLERATCEKSRSPSLSPEPPFREKSPSLL